MIKKRLRRNILSFFILPVIVFATTNIGWGAEQQDDDNRWSEHPLSPALIQVPGNGNATNASIVEIRTELERAKQEILFLRSALAWAINPFFPHISDPSVLAFRGRLQARLSTLFGKQKLEIEGEETSYLMIFTNSVDSITEYIPNTEVQTALKILVKSVQIGRELYAYARQAQNNPYIFSSFAEIDRVSYLVSAGIASIYSPQIERLDESQAITLAECAYNSLSSFVKRSRNNGRIGISPDQLILALGKYHLGTVQRVFARPGNPHRRATLIAHINNGNWYDMDLFLGSGIKVENSYYNPTNTAYYYYNPRNTQGLIYTKAPNLSGTYGFRNGTLQYVYELNLDEPNVPPFNRLTINFASTVAPVLPQQNLVGMQAGTIDQLVEGRVERDGQGTEQDREH